MSWRDNVAQADVSKLFFRSSAVGEDMEGGEKEVKVEDVNDDVACTGVTSSCSQVELLALTVLSRQQDVN